jgi:hypothetical protein
MRTGKIILTIVVLFTFGAVCYSQGSDIQIKKKTSFKIPGMPSIAGTGELENRPSTIYLKGMRMRTDMQYKKRRMTGGKETVTQTMILQCDKQRRVQFNSKSKKYYTDLLAGDSPDAVKKAEKGGTVTLAGSVTDTGERATLFGFAARRLRQTMTLTPGKNSCQKQTIRVDVDGWYADVPEFSCPIKRDPQEFKMDRNCFDEVVYQMKGAVSGIPLKEIKTLTIDGQSINIEEEVVEVTKTTLTDDLFEPPANYKAANTLKEVEEDDGAEENTANRQAPLPVVPATDSKLALPTAGLEKAPLQAKKTGVVRIGIAKPSVTLPDSKKDATVSNELAAAISALLAENLRTEKVEVVELEGAEPAAEAKQKECDYIFYLTVTQKRSGGLFGGMLPTMPTMPGGGNSPTNTIDAPTEAGRRMQGMMLQTARPKDEFTFDYKVADLNNTVVAQAVAKTKAKQYGEDVLSPQIKEASVAVLSKVEK